MAEQVPPETISYFRLSTRDQSENSNALDQQIKRLELAGAELVIGDIESGREGKEADRPNFQKMMGWVRAGLVKKVIITRLDRLSRSLPTLRKALDEFKRSGCVLVALDDNIDLSTAGGKFHVNMLGALAEMESDRLSERILHGKEHFRREKRASHPPFGYRVQDYKFFPDTEPFLCCLGDRQAYSKAEMGRALIDHYLQHRSLNAACRYFSDRFGYAEFWQTALRSWLTSPVLQGDLVYFPKSKTPEIHPNTHEPLISREEARSIKEILAFNHKVGGFGHRRGVYSLTGLVRCECGSRCIVANGAGGKYKYFICAGAKVGKCDRRKGARLELLEQAAINALIGRAEAIAQFANTPGTAEESQELKDLKDQLSGLEQIADISKNVNPAVMAAIRTLRNQIDQLQQERQTDRVMDGGTRSLLMQTFSRPDFWAELEADQKQRFFRVLLDHVQVSNGTILQVFLKV